MSDKPERWFPFQYFWALILGQLLKLDEIFICTALKSGQIYLFRLFISRNWHDIGKLNKHSEITLLPPWHRQAKKWKKESLWRLREDRKQWSDRTTSTAKLNYLWWSWAQETKLSNMEKWGLPWEVGENAREMVFIFPSQLENVHIRSPLWSVCGLALSRGDHLTPPSFFLLFLFLAFCSSMFKQMDHM